ncbi:transcriptional regulator [Candidatus Regiella endosymbiont of Tuberolachnus salignus]|uniref:transcriptional regulator n=1 Tax=Candidatus Regiella endosymbiont of Tuberolachnus salignus TaxID=3077956 RepID=UPI0030CDAF7E
MTAFDLTQCAVLRKVFPELTNAQFETAILFAVGFSRKEIAGLRVVSDSCIEHTLNVVKEKFNIASIGSLRNIILLRYLLSKK